MDEQHTERLQMRVPPDFLREVDNWRRSQDDLPNRSEAIRRIVEIGSKISDPISFIHIPDGIKDAIEKAAKDDDRPVASYVERVITQHLKDKGYLPK